MSARETALEYVAPPPESLWNWADGGEVIVWSDGTTVVFREEMEQVLSEIAGRGLPPFGPLVLLLAACRGRVPDRAVVDVFLGMKFALVEGRSEQYQQYASVAGRLAEERLLGVLEKLRSIGRFPPALITGTRAKAILVQTVLETEVEIAPADAEDVLEVLCDGLVEEELQVNRRRTGADCLIADLDMLHAGLKRLDPASLALREKTGLDVPPSAANVELPRAEDVRKLLREIRSDARLDGLARVARDIMAALHLPRSISEIDDSSTGGVADISNRGPIHRLLIGELAHDDLTLAVRIALNEALYLRREPPSRQDPVRSALLLDSGIRLWGVPRLFATAAGMALLANAQSNASLAAFRAARRRVVPIAPGSREGWLAHLEVLEPTPHPGDAVRAFVDQASRGSGELQLVIVSHRRALEDPVFLSRLDEFPGMTFHLAAVDGDGNFSVARRTPRGSLPVCTAKINLESLTSPSEPDALPLRITATALPAILRQTPLPFLLPVQVKLDRSLPVGTGGICITRRGSVWLWHGPLEGARILAAAPMRGQTCAFLAEEVSRRAWILKLRGGAGELRLFTIGWESGGPPELRADRVLLRPSNAPPAQSFIHGGFLHLVFQRHTDIYALEEGGHVHNCAHPEGMVPVSDRFFHNRIHDEWNVLSYDGLRASFEPVRRPHLAPNDDVRLLFRRRGHEGPWAITSLGHLIDTAQPNERVLLDLPNAVARATLLAGGRRLLVECADSPKQSGYVIDLGETIPKYSPIMNHAGVVECPIHPPFRTVRVQFSGVGVTPEGILLKSRRQSVALIFDKERQCFALRELPRGGAAVAVRDLEPAPVPEDASYELSAAEFPKGIIHLDSRGMLHVQSRDALVPEMSFVLAAVQSLPAWTSDGDITGSSYFVKSQRAGKAADLYRVFERLISSLQ